MKLFPSNCKIVTTLSLNEKSKGRFLSPKTSTTQSNKLWPEAFMRKGNYCYRIFLLPLSKKDILTTSQLKKKKIIEYDSFDYLVVFALFKTLQHFDKSENEIITIGHCYLHQLFIDLC